MRLVTWNINSIRFRIENLCRLIQETSPDIICLQETKVIDSLFPFKILEELGYSNIVFCGQKSYNGVAIISKILIDKVDNIELIEGAGCRHISVNFRDIELHNFYVPAGGDIPDVTTNPSFAQKLSFLDAMHDWFSLNRKGQDKIIMVGDFNVAPLEHDVWSHKQLSNVICHTPIEIEKLNKLKDSFAWCDVSRHFIDANQKLYSWWSYRNIDYKKSNRGRRLDHIWVTESLVPYLNDSFILTQARDWPKPSDHVPVIADFKF